MKKFGRKILAWLLCLTMTAGMAALPANAAIIGETYDADNVTTSISDNGDGLVQGVGSFGNLLATEISGATGEEQGENSYFGITDVVISENRAVVEYYSAMDCSILVGLYDENTDELLISQKTTASKESTTVEVLFDANKMPKYFTLKAFMIDSIHNPLCDKFESSLYTSGVQKVKNSKTSDFDEKIQL